MDKKQLNIAEILISLVITIIIIFFYLQNESKYPSILINNKALCFKN